MNKIGEWETLNNEIIACRQCPRMVEWREQVARERRRAYREWEYWGKPVPGFGDIDARVLIVGLAPGAHGSNRTGRMFTGDSSGDFLYRALHKVNYSSSPVSKQVDDGLSLRDVYITAVCRCAPPDNKPTSKEISTCLPYLEREIQMLRRLRGIVVLGKIAFDYVLQHYRRVVKIEPAPIFSHTAFYSLGSDYPWLLASYHPSRQNTQTGRLTEAMFDSIWSTTSELLRSV